MYVGQQVNTKLVAAFSDVIASIPNSSMAESLNEDKEVTFIDMWQERPVLCENVSIIQKDILMETSDSPH